MGDSVEQNILRRQLLRRFQAALAGPLDGEARDTFLAESDRSINAAAPPPSVASKRKAFRVV